MREPKAPKIAELRNDKTLGIDFAGMPVDPVPKGEPYEEALKATEGIIVTAGIWYMYQGGEERDQTRDRFGSGAAFGGLNISQAIEFLYRLGVEGVSFHYPGEYGEDNAAIIDQVLAERGMALASAAANTFSYPIFSKGGPCNNDPKIRELALLLNMRAQEINVAHGRAFQTDWAGRDASAGHFFDRASEKWNWTREVYVKNVLSVSGKCGYAIEFKPYDPGERAIMADVNGALRMCYEVEDTIREILVDLYGPEAGLKNFEENYRGCMGVNIEDAHVYLLKGHQTVADAVDLALNAGRYFLRHPNDAIVSDTDDILGKYHILDAIETAYVELSYGYNGPYEPDILPKDDDRLAAMICSINQVNRMRAVARELLEDDKWARRFQEARKSECSSKMIDFLDDFMNRNVPYPKIPLKLADQFRKDL